jgi:DNA-binding SARP family transcriptional activator
MELLDVRLLGRFSVRRSGHAVPHMEVSKTQELLSFLLLNRLRPHHREQLAETLWGDNRPDQARKYLRQTLWMLQRALGSDSDEDQPKILVVDSQWVNLDYRAISHVDIIELEDAFELVRDVPGHEFTPRQRTIAQKAVSLYHSSLLEGWYQDWCLFERQRLETIYLILLQKLMSHCAAIGKYEEGIWYGHRILACDSAREQTHRQMMELYAQSGDRTSALRQYERCVSVLRKELDVGPSLHTNALVARIRADDTAQQPLVFESDNMAHPTESESSLNDIAVRLSGIRSALSDVAQQLENEIGVLNDNAWHSLPLSGRRHQRRTRDAQVDTNGVELPH